MQDTDVIIIGSGPAGVHAAWPLVDAGKRVTMLDGGMSPPVVLSSAPDLHFEEIRTKDHEQWRWFLGEDLSGIPLSGLTGGLGGGQISGNRSYVTAATEKHLPLQLSNAFVIQSLAEGGLGAAWGATCAYLTDDELATMGLPADEMQMHYRTVTERIGISGSDPRYPMDPPWKGDHHAEAMLGMYQKKKSWFRAKNIGVMQPPTAVLTKDKKGRRATGYHDTDYFLDPRRSVYRPQYTLEELKKKQNFHYVGGVVARTVQDVGASVRVSYQRMQDGVMQTVEASRVILAAGAVGSARILLESRGLHGAPITFVGKPHVLTACIRLGSLGMKGAKDRLSLCQMLVTDEEKRDGCTAGAAQLYSYRSLQLFRLLTSLPLPTPLAMGLLSMLTPSLLIADIRFPALRLANNTLSLIRSGEVRRVRIEMHKDTEDMRARERSLRRIKKGLSALGLLPIRTMQLEEASTSHYAGTIPSSRKPEGLLSSDTRGKIHGMEHVYVADASALRCLPPTPHTLTIMANANRVGEEVLKDLASHA